MIKSLVTTVSSGATLNKNGKIDWSKSGIGRDEPEYENFFLYMTKGKQADGLNYKTLRTDSESKAAT